LKVNLGDLIEALQEQKKKKNKKEKKKKKRIRKEATEI